MPKTNTSGAVNNSILSAPIISLTKLTKAQLIDFAKIACRIKNRVYLCCARTMQTASQSTYSNAIKRCPLSTSAMQLCRSGEQNGGNASFYTYILNF